MPVRGLGKRMVLAYSKRRNFLKVFPLSNGNYYSKKKKEKKKQTTKKLPVRVASQLQCSKGSGPRVFQPSDRDRCFVFFLKQLSLTINI